MIKILQALTRGTAGGTELMVARLVERLDLARFSCDVTILEGEAPAVEHLRGKGIGVYELSSGGGATSSVVRFYQLIRRHRYRVIHAYGFRMSLLARLAARAARPRPIVVHGIRGLHVTEDEEPSRVKTRVALAVERATSRLVDAYVANSRGALDFLRTQGLPEHKLATIRNGIDLSEWPRRRGVAVSGPPVVVCVANFRKRKRHVDVVEAIRILLERGVAVSCRFVGDGPTQSEVREEARRRGVSHAIAFIGSCAPSEVKTVLTASDVFVLASLWEGMPGSVMEAMAVGLPVVGTDVPGTNELVVDGVTGYLVPARNPGALAERVAVLIADPKLRSRMAEAARDRVRREFSMDRMVAEHEVLYERLVRERST